MSLMLLIPVIFQDIGNFSNPQTCRMNLLLTALTVGAMNDD